MAETIEMPKLSDTMTVGTLVKWLKNEGDKVKNGDMLAEVETDKATMELECFFDGVLLKIFAPNGSQVEVGSPLCAIGKPGEKVDVPATPAPAKSGEQGAESQAPAAKDVAMRVSASTETPPVAASVSKPTATGSQPSAPGSQPKPGRIRISPLARKLAAEKGIDPSTLSGSGPHGRIVRADVLAGSTRAPGSTPHAAAPVGAAGDLQPVSNMRATIARRLVEAKSTIPHFYVEIEIDAAPLLEMRTQLNAGMEKDAKPGTTPGKLSVNDFILKAVAHALRKVPAVNSSWEAAPSTGSGSAAIRRHTDVHVSMAVAIEDGLITPVIRNTDQKSLIEISAETKTLAKRAKEKKLAPAEYTGGTFCVTNLGMMGVDRFSAIINPPNAAILAVGATVKKPVVADDRIAVGQRMSLTLSCDHRVVDGATGATFLAAVRELLEKPVLLFL